MVPFSASSIHLFLSLVFQALENSKAWASQEHEKLVNKLKMALRDKDKTIEVSYFIIRFLPVAKTSYDSFISDVRCANHQRSSIHPLSSPIGQSLGKSLSQPSK